MCSIIVIVNIIELFSCWIELLIFDAISQFSCFLGQSGMLDILVSVFNGWLNLSSSPVYILSTGARYSTRENEQQTGKMSTLRGKWHHFWQTIQSVEQCARVQRRRAARARVWALLPFPLGTKREDNGMVYHQHVNFILTWSTMKRWLEKLYKLSVTTDLDTPLGTKRTNTSWTWDSASSWL